MSNGKRVAWQEILQRKDEFVGGQILSAEPLPGNGGVLVRGEISDIIANGNEIVIRTAWSAMSGGGNAWYKMKEQSQISGSATGLILYEDGGYEFSIVYISGCQTLYPKGHESNIPLGEIVEETA